MSQIDPNSLTDWQNGQTITAELYKQEREILYVSINDNYSLITNFSVTTSKIADGAVTTNKIATGALDGRYYTETEVDALLNGIILGQILDDSLTNAKLATDVKVGSLATLTTATKTSVVGAINELKNDIISIPTPVGSIVYSYKNFGGAL